MLSTVQPEPTLCRGVGTKRSGLVMVAVSTRPAVRERLKRVCEELSFEQPRLVECVEQVLRCVGRPAVLLLDLGSCCRDPQLTAVVRRWEMSWPESPVVLFAPLLDRESELRVAVRLSRELHRSEFRLLTASEFCGDGVWRELRSWGVRGALVEELRADLLAAIAATGRVLKARGAVLEVLRGVTGSPPTYASEHASLEEPPFESARAADDRERKSRWRALHRDGQLPASQLLTLFRVLWYTRLRDQGWRTDRIAQFVGFRTARHFRRTMSRRLGIGLRQLACLPYERALNWAALQLTDGSLPRGLPVTPTRDRVSG